MIVIFKTNANAQLRGDVIRMTTPIIIEQSLLVFMGLVSTMMVSRLSNEAVSAVGMVDSICNMVIAFFSALAVGGTVVIGHFVGQRNFEKVNATVVHTVAVGGLVAIVITVLLYSFKLNIVDLLYANAPPDVLQNVFDYFDIAMFSIPMLALVSVINSLLRGSGDTKSPLKITVFMNVINLLLAALLIYGINIQGQYVKIYVHGFAVVGAAYAITIARFVGCIMAVFVIIRGNDNINVRRLKTIKLDFGIVKSIFGVGIPSGLEAFQFSIGKLVTQTFIVGAGIVDMAAYNISWSIFNMIIIPGQAMQISTTTMVSHALGRREPNTAQQIVKYLRNAAFGLHTVLGVSAVVSAPWLLTLFTSSAQVADECFKLLCVAMFTLPTLWPLSFLIPAGLRGAGDNKFVFMISVASMWLFRVCLGFALSVTFGMGVMGVWLAMMVDWLCRSIFFYRRFRSGIWLNKNVIKN